MSDKLKVLFVSSEVTPYAKSGGLGDVAGSLPKELVKCGVDVRVVFPKYRNIKESLLTNLTYINSFEVALGWRKQSASIYKIDADAPTYLIENSYYFDRDGFYGYGDDYERFSFFTKAAIESLSVTNFIPDVIHFNDWQTGIGCVYLNDVYSRFLALNNTKSLFTIHNLQYQGVYGRGILWNIDLNDGYFVDDKLEFHGNVSLMKAGLTYSNYISTVSETYANEIQTEAFGYGMSGVLRSRNNQLCGILNGIDTDIYNPETDTKLFANYSVNDLKGKLTNKLKLQEFLDLPVKEEVPVIGIISRLVDQKGFDILADVIDEILRRDVQIVVLGTGDGRYEHMFKHLAYRYPDKLSANICFNEELAQRIYAASDLFLMPSLFEPCGLGQIIAMRYGAIPVVRKTGGLSDTVTHYSTTDKKGNGFLFEDYLASGIHWAIDEALNFYYDKKEWKTIVKNAMNSDFSWHKSAEKYVALYKQLKES